MHLYDYVYRYIVFIKYIVGYKVGYWYIVGYKVYNTCHVNPHKTKSMDDILAICGQRFKFLQHYLYYLSKSINMRIYLPTLLALYVFSVCCLKHAQCFHYVSPYSFNYLILA